MPDTQDKTRFCHMRKIKLIKPRIRDGYYNVIMRTL